MIQRSRRELQLSKLDSAVAVEVEYVYLPGMPEIGPSFSSGGEPPVPPDAEIIRVTLLEDTLNVPRGTDISSCLSVLDYDILIEQLISEQ